MKMFDTYDLRSFDPNGGVLVLTTYWRPRAEDPDPDYPGEKLSAVSYLPTRPEKSCPCGSGRIFAKCCQPLPYWRLLCPNPDMQDYNFVRPQSARFTSVPTQTVHAFLQNDERLYCVEDTPKRAFWLYWGDPAYDTPPYGTICFGDLELQKPHTLLVTVMSDRRMEILLDLLRPLELATPEVQLDSLSYPPKPTQRTSGRKRRRSL